MKRDTAEIIRTLPDFPWTRPVVYVDGDGVIWWKCRICMASDGHLAEAFESCADHVLHLERDHPDVLVVSAPRPLTF